MGKKEMLAQLMFGLGSIQTWRTTISDAAELKETT